MKDQIGNRIEKGSLLYWQSKQMAVVVADVSTGGLSLADSKMRTPPTITLQITIPINLGPNVTAETCALQDFLCLVNPEATKIVEGMIQQ